MSLALSPSEIRSLITALFRRKSRKGHGNPFQQNRSCLTQRPEGLGCQKWMEINSADNAGPYLGAAGAEAALVSPQDLIGLGLALWPLFGALAPMLARDPHRENRRKSEQVVSDLQLQHSSGLCFSPHCPWWLFLDTVLSQNSCECDHCRTVGGQCGLLQRLKPPLSS